MRIRNLLKSRKGISPILATLLLIVIAVAAIVVTYAWIMTYMTNAGQQASVFLSVVNTRFYNDTTKKIDLDVINTGTADTQIIKIYAGPAKGNLAEQTPSPAAPITLSHSSTVTITISYDWTPGAIMYFTIVPSQGAPLTEIPEQAPNS